MGWDGIDSPPLISPFLVALLFLFFAASCDSFINAFRRYRAFLPALLALLALLCFLSSYFALVFVKILLHILELRVSFSVSLHTLLLLSATSLLAILSFLGVFSLSLSLSRILVQKQKSSPTLLEAPCLCLFVLLLFFLLLCGFAGVVAALVKFFFFFFILECHSKRKKKKKKEGGGGLIRRRGVLVG
jgi:hypothetical protein